MTRVSGLLAVVVGFLCASANAHHSVSAYNVIEAIAIQGTVVRFDWTNPHVYLVIETSDGSEWTIETDSTSVMTRSGWTRDSFKAGDEVTARVNPARDAKRMHGLLLSITGPSGADLASLNRTRRAGFPEGPPTRAPGLAGVWSGDQAAAAAFFGAMANHPLTPKGQRAKAEYTDAMNPAFECIAWPTPFINAANIFYLNEMEVRDEVVLLRSEFYNTERVIYLDGRQHPNAGERSNQGHSIGWWEGETLVVDTTLFADHRSTVPNLGIPGGQEKHVVERFALSDDGTRMLIDVLVEDPEYLAEPVSARLVWHYAPQLEMLRFACNPEVARRSAL